MPFREATRGLSLRESDPPDRPGAGAPSPTLEEARAALDDLDADPAQLAERLDAAPVEGRFEPAHAVIIASHLQVGKPEIPASLTAPLTPEEYTSLVVHAAVDAENS